MQIKVAKSAGFCFGVKRAVGIAEKYAESGVPAVTLGEIIHNPSVVEDLKKRGVYPAFLYLFCLFALFNDRFIIP